MAPLAPGSPTNTTSRLRHLAGVVALVVVGILAALPGASATTEAPTPSVVISVDGDAVVLAPAGVTPPPLEFLQHDADDDHYDAKGGAAAGAGSGSGYTTYDGVWLREHYDVVLVASHDIERIRPAVADAVADAASVGVSIALRPGQAESHEPPHGEIRIVMSSSSPCPNPWLACGGPIVGEDGSILSGKVWVNPRLLSKSPHEIANTIRHELGHTLGLAHYDGAHDGSTQVMHSRRFDAAHFQSGDRAGLAHLAGVSPTPAAQRTPAPAPAPAAPPVEGAIESTTGVGGVVELSGWAVDPSVRHATVRIRVGTLVWRTTANLGHQRGTVGWRSIVVVPPGVTTVCAEVAAASGPVPIGCADVRAVAGAVHELGLL